MSMCSSVCDQVIVFFWSHMICPESRHVKTHQWRTTWMVLRGQRSLTEGRGGGVEALEDVLQ